MVSYLNERHTSQLRAQIRKVAATRSSPAPSPTPGAEPPGYPNAYPQTASASGRAPSALSMRRDAILSRENDGTGSVALGTSSNNKPSHPVRPPISRNSSANTAVLTQQQNLSQATRPTSRLNKAHRHRLSLLSIPAQEGARKTPSPDHAVPGSPSPLSSSTSSSSSEDVLQSRLNRRPPRFITSADGPGDADDESDESDPAFLPFQHRQSGPPRRVPASGNNSAHDLGATLRGLRMPPHMLHGHQGPISSLHHESQTSDSDASSAAVLVGSGRTTTTSGDRDRDMPGNNSLLGALSPKRTAELAGRSPVVGGSRKGKTVLSREGSDGTPSMGSSFSDLDGNVLSPYVSPMFPSAHADTNPDASVTQSALEEHLASRMRDGTIGSRMSTIGHAFRSRVMPKPPPSSGGGSGSGYRQ